MEAGPSNGPQQAASSSNNNNNNGQNRGPAPQSAATLAAFSNAAFTTSGALMDLVDR